jgi:hypothetical protein
MNRSDYLFHAGDLRATIDNIRSKLVTQIGQLTPSQLLPADDSKVVAHFVADHEIDAIQIQEEGIELIEPREIEVERVDQHFGERYRQKLLEFRFEIPFTGDPGLFGLQPATYTMSPPRAVVQGQNVVFTLQRADRNKDAIRNEFDAFLNTVRQYIGWQKDQIGAWNKGLPTLVEQQVAARREKLIADKQLVTDLGFRVRSHGAPAASYNFPVQRKAVVPSLPAAKPGPMLKPEPVLEMAVYEEILDTLAGMSVVMERSPSAFAGLDEEALRTHFQIPLNSKFQGMASGETFNAAGKTDILIKHEDRILFIAECKFWKGAQSLTDAISQLLSYLTWRETKAAILLFNQNKNFSSVLDQIPGIFARHPQFVRQERYEKMSGFRFVVRHPTDAGRHLLVTLLAFDVPAQPSTQKTE